MLRPTAGKHELHPTGRSIVYDITLYLHTFVWYTHLNWCQCNLSNDLYEFLLDRYNVWSFLYYLFFSCKFIGDVCEYSWWIIENKITLKCVYYIHFFEPCNACYSFTLLRILSWARYIFIAFHVWIDATFNRQEWRAVYHRIARVHVILHLPCDGYRMFLNCLIFSKSRFDKFRKFWSVSFTFFPTKFRNNL